MTPTPSNPYKINGRLNDGRPSRAIIQKMIVLAEEANEAKLPVMELALIALARISLLDLPDGVCKAMVNSCIMMSDAVVDAFKRRPN